MLFSSYSMSARLTLLKLIEQREIANENSKPKIDLAINLICLRQNANKKQLEVAKDLRISQKNLSQWERGVIAPSLKHLLALANYYSVSVDELLKTKSF